MGDFKISMAAARVNANMTQGELAEKMGVSIVTILKWEKGTTAPTILQFKKFCEICGAPEDIIFLPGE